MKMVFAVLLFFVGFFHSNCNRCVGQVGRESNELESLLKDAVDSFRKKTSRYGGYVYYHSLDNSNRWGEGLATETQIWVQPPGTPTIGETYLRAYSATGDRYYLNAATETATALIFGQLRSGGWTNVIDFDPKGKRSANYRNNKGRGKNNSSLDDDQTTAAIRFLILADKACDFRNDEIHQSAQLALRSMLNAQFENGGFPQVWNGPVAKSETTLRKIKANYPDFDWRTEGKIKNYWELYTLNDNVTGNVAATLKLASNVYKSDRYIKALKKLGDFLILAQMPAPQRGWAQQYNDQMQPTWARKFEPPAISGDETQETVETLLLIAVATNDRKYLEPIPAAIKWLKESILCDGKLARYYELKTNRPLFMNRSGKDYFLTYSDSNLPDHYGWKTQSRIDQIESRYQELVAANHLKLRKKTPPKLTTVDQLISELEEKFWVSVYAGEKLVGQPKFKTGERYLSSGLFSRNVMTICDYLDSRNQDQR